MLRVYLDFFFFEFVGFILLGGDRGREKVVDGWKQREDQRKEKGEKNKGKYNKNKNE